MGVVYPDRRGALFVKTVGYVARRRKGGADSTTLMAAGFQPGDALTVTAARMEQVPHVSAAHAAQQHSRAGGGAQHARRDENGMGGAMRRRQG